MRSLPRTRPGPSLAAEVGVRWPRIAAVVCLGLAGAAVGLAEEPAPDFAEVQSLMGRYCFQCHNPEKHKGGVNLMRFESEEAFREEPFTVEDIAEVLSHEEMPPEKADQPTAEERARMVRWAKGLVRSMEQAAPNDPGVVVVPRINSQEYDNVVRDLTGLPLKLGQFLTADSSAGEGFLNVGAALPMQVGNFESFLAAGKKLLEHARILPGVEILWSGVPHPPAENDRELADALKVLYVDWHDERLARLLDGHFKALAAAGKTAPEAYFEGAWRYQHRAALGRPEATFADVAMESPVPLLPGVLEKCWRLMARDESVEVHRNYLENPLFRELTARFARLPAPAGPGAPSPGEEIAQLAAWRDRIGVTHAEFGHRYDPLEEALERADAQALRAGSVPRGEYPYRLDLSKMKGAHLYFCVSSLFDGSEGDIVLITDGELEFADGSKQKLARAVPGFADREGKPVPFGSHPAGAPIGPDAVAIGSGGYLKMAVPPGARRLRVTMRVDERHAPETTVQTLITETPPGDFTEFRARWILGSKKKATKLAYGQLGEWGNTGPSSGLPRDLLFQGFDAPALDYLGLKGKQLSGRWSAPQLFSVEPAEISRGAAAADLARRERVVRMIAAAARAQGASAQELEMAAGEHLARFAAAAWRRPATPEELEGLLRIYRSAEDGKPFESRVKTALAAVLVSPEFLYRFTASKGSADAYPISGRELATKLAFVFWASLPDEALLARADRGELSDPAHLKGAVRQMLADPRARGFVEQFVGHWLQFAGFDAFSGPDAMKYPGFTDSLKWAMNEEVVLFFLDLFRNDKPVTLALDADYSFLNAKLAGHYGIQGVEGTDLRPVNVPADRRGGVLGMGAVLTKLSAPLRTSPVKRGVWIHEQLLGVKLAEPPPNVPLLSDEETNDQGLTIAQQLAAHRADPSCASCHDKFDPLGVALESFDPVGRWRTQIEGAPVDDVGKFPDGKTLRGFRDLKGHLMAGRDQFAQTFNRKLLAYALGRALLPSDKPLLEQMGAALKGAGYAPSASIDLLVTSRQFLLRRDDLASAPPPSQKAP